MGSQSEPRSLLPLYSHSIGINANAGSSPAAFTSAHIYEPTLSESDSTKLSRRPGRQYNLALASEIIYSSSAFRRYLVTSQAHHQIGFLPVGNWWVYSSDGDATGRLEKVPNTREDLFENKTLDFPDKRKLVKILRFVLEYDNDEEMAKWEQYRDAPFSSFLSAVFKASEMLVAPLLALTMSTKNPESMTTQYALPRIARHLRSIGTLGKFSALIPKYGGLDEFCQVACRACAVGGGVYVLGKGMSTAAGSVSLVQSLTETPPEAKPLGEDESPTGETPTAVDEPEQGPRVKLHLKDGEAVTSRWFVSESYPNQASDSLCKSISIISSPLPTLFPPVVVEDRPFQPGSAILVFPPGSLEVPEQPIHPPVHIHIHSSESGECPVGQSKFFVFVSVSPSQAIMMIDYLNTYLHCPNYIDDRYPLTT